MQWDVQQHYVTYHMSPNTGMPHAVCCVPYVRIIMISAQQILNVPCTDTSVIIGYLGIFLHSAKTISEQNQHVTCPMSHTNISCINTSRSFNSCCMYVVCCMSYVYTIICHTKYVIYKHQHNIWLMLYVCCMLYVTCMSTT